MNFQKIPEIKNYEYYTDIAFREARKEFEQKTFRAKSKESIAKKRAEIKITAVNTRLCKDLVKILRDFPHVEDLNEFYYELFSCYFSIDEYKKDLSNVNWLVKKVKQFSNIYAKKAKSAKDPKEIDTFVGSYYGRISSMFKQVKSSFEHLELYRKSLREMPAIKPHCLNVVLYGFPNVGKSTLLSKLTTAKPEISNYEFTTKKINMGYRKKGGVTLQIFDTPGTLNRFEKMNAIEKQAFLVLKHLADVIIFVFDAGRDFDEQKQLFDSVSKEMIIYCSKVDLHPQSEILSKVTCLTTLEGLEASFIPYIQKKELELLELKKSGEFEFV
ncbi:MAG: GTPase [Candidatus Woesearchaeota archaeon]